VVLAQAKRLVAQEPISKEIPRVIIVTLGGVRNSESLGDPAHQYMSKMWGEMLKEGVLYTKLVDLNFEFHMPSVNAIITGKNYAALMPIETPTLFQYVRKKYHLPQNRIWSIGQWDYNACVFKTPGYDEQTYPSQIAVLDFKSPSNEEKEFSPLLQDFASRFRIIQRKRAAQFECTQWNALEEVCFMIFKEISSKFKPYFLHYVIGSPDSAHYDTFSQYVLSLKRSDEIIFDIWKMIKTEPFYKGNTYLIVCVDHTRNSYYMHHTENSDENPSQVWMYVFGSGVKKNTVLDRPVYHTDIFATVARIMDVKTLPTEGRLLEDCFEEGVLPRNEDSIKTD